MRSFLVLASLCVVAFSAHAAPFRSTVLDIFSSPYSIEDFGEIYRTQGFVIAAVRHELRSESDFPPGFYESWRVNWISDGRTGYDISIATLRIERADRQRFTLSEIGINYLYTGALLTVANYGPRDQYYNGYVGHAPWDALALTYQQNGVVTQQRISPWGNDVVIDDRGYWNGRKSIRVNANKVDWIELTVDHVAFPRDPCDARPWTLIKDPALARQTRTWCLGAPPYLYDLGTAQDLRMSLYIGGQRNDSVFASVRTLKVSPVPVPAGLALLGPVVLGLGLAAGLRRRGAQAGRSLGRM